MTEKNKNTTAPEKQKKKHYILSGAILIALAYITYKAIFSHYDFALVPAAIRSASIPLLLFAAALALAHTEGEGICIKLVMDALGYRVSHLRAFKYASIGFYFCGITPSSTGGQPAQVFYMNRDDYPPSVGTAAILLVSLIYKLVILTLGLLLICFKTSIIFTGVPYFRILFTIGIIINSGIVFLCGALIFKPKMASRISHFCVRLLEKLHLTSDPKALSEKLDGQLSEYHDAAVYLKTNLGLSIKVFLVTTVQRLCMFSVAYVVYRAFGFNSYSLLDIVALQVATAFAVDSMPLPGAVGASEAVFLGLFKNIYKNGTVPALLLTRGIGYYMLMIFSGLVTLACHLTQKHRIGKKLRSSN